MSLYGFLKISIFSSKSIDVSLQFYRKSSTYGKNWPKLHISWSWPQCSRLVIHNGLIYEFLWVFQNFKFLLKIHRCKPSVLLKIVSLWQQLTETPYFSIVRCNTAGVTVVAIVHLQCSTVFLHCLLQSKPSSSEFQVQIWTLFDLFLF
jgi:hypothetical protein